MPANKTTDLLIIVTSLPRLLVRLKLLKVSNEPQSPVIHLYLASFSGSRDQDAALLRKIVSLVSYVFKLMIVTRH